MPDDTTQTPDRADAESAAPVAVPPPAGVPEDDGRPRALAYVGLLLGGVLLGIFGTVLASMRVVAQGHTVWWGVGLVLVSLMACVRGAAWFIGSRRGAAVVGLGWVLPSLAFTVTNPGGDVLLPDEARTYVYLVGAVVIVVLAVALPLPKGVGPLAAEHRRRGGAVQPVEPLSSTDQP